MHVQDALWKCSYLNQEGFILLHGDELQKWALTQTMEILGSPIPV